MNKVAPSEWHKDPNSLRGTRLLVEPTDDWIVRRKVKNAERVDGHPITLLLLDRQINPDRLTRYIRYVRRLETPQSVQDAGRIELDFDPSTQKLLIHAISIFRDGALTNYADLSEVNIIQRERELEKGIYDGNITALILLKDLRTGDVIDIETSIASDDAIFPEHYWFAEYFEHTLPLVQQHFSWLSRDHDRFQIRSTAEDLTFTEEECPEGLRKTWSQEHCSAIDLPPCLPLGFQPFEQIAFTSFKDWQEVAQEVCQLWSRTEKPGEALPAELVIIREKYEDRSEALIENLIAFVRDNIRYQGVETGRLGLVPEELHTIWERRYGDCKEKTSLLCWMLRECGFEATPALVSVGMRGRVSQQLPAPIFDHVVVHLRYEGADYWVDPTDVSQRGGLASLTSLPFEKALLISDDSAEFIEIAEAVPGANLLKVHEEYFFPGNGTDAEIKVSHSYHGSEANGVRHALDSQGRVTVQKIFSEIVKSTRPNAELKNDLEISDDQAENIVVIRAEFLAPETLSRPNGSASLAAEFVPHSVVGKLVGVDDGPRSFPLGLVHPVEVEHLTIVRHQDAKGSIVPKTIIDNEFIKFVAGTENKGDFPTIKYHFRSKASEVPADQIHRYRLNLKQISQVISLVFETKGFGVANQKSKSGRAPSWEEEELNPSLPRQRRSRQSHYDPPARSIPIWPIIAVVVVIIKVVLIAARQN